jgi:hypothetical protein
MTNISTEAKAFIKRLLIREQWYVENDLFSNSILKIMFCKAWYTYCTLTDGQQLVFALLFPVIQVWNKLLSSCGKVDELNRLAASCSNKSDIVST